MKHKKIFIGNDIQYKDRDTYTKLFREIKKSHKEYGSNIIQIYLRAPYTVSKFEIINFTSKQKENIKKYITKNNIHLYIHSNYLPNLCSYPPEYDRMKWQLDVIKGEIITGYELGAKGIIIHHCSPMNNDSNNRDGINKNKNIALDNVVNNLKNIIDTTINTKTYGINGEMKIILETGSSTKKIGTDINDLSIIYKKLGRTYSKYVKVCIDTAHSYIVGHQINTITGMKDFLKQYKIALGKNYSDKIEIIHLNDTYTENTGGRDLHAPLGNGYIFGDKNGLVLEYIIDFAKDNNISIILESHIGYKKDIELVKKIISENTNTKYNGIIGGNNTKTKSNNSNSSLIINEKIKNKIIDQFTKLRDYRELEGFEYKSNVYDKVIKDLYVVWEDKNKNKNKIITLYQLKKEIGLGKSSYDKIKEIIKITDDNKQLNDGKELKQIIDIEKKHPEFIIARKLMTVSGIGPKHALDLVKKDKIKSINDLKKKVNDGDSKIELTHHQEIGLKYYDELNCVMNRKEIKYTVDKIEELLEKNIKTKINITIAGSYRMKREYSNDIDLIITFPSIKTRNSSNTKNMKIKMNKVIQLLFDNNIIIDEINSGVNIYTAIVNLDFPNNNKNNNKNKNKNKKCNITKMDIHFVPLNEYPFHLLYFSSGEFFSRNIRSYAKKRGLKLNDKGITYIKTGKIPKGAIPGKDIKTERDIFNFLDIPYIQPDLR